MINISEKNLSVRAIALCFQVSQKSGIWEGANSSSGGVAEGPSRSVSHAASLDAISKRAVKPETARAPCRSLTCSVCKYIHGLHCALISIHSSCRELPNLALALSEALFYFTTDIYIYPFSFSCVVFQF